MGQWCGQVDTDHRPVVMRGKIKLWGDASNNSAEPENDDDLVQREPKRRKARATGMRLVHRWLIDALKALGAYGDVATGDLAHAANHGQIWIKFQEMNKHRLTNPAEAAQLQRDERVTFELLGCERRSGGGW